ncbi:MAG: hypothetical protein E6Q97_16705 [Desulfurellales bacterium]|nr:MAG: hypothetical protein E6Q97_16705 [Desulfurellales bacterium]
MTDPTIERARALLADASPEMRRAVGELVKDAMYMRLMDEVGNHTWKGGHKPYEALASEFIEGGKQ